MYLNQMLMLSTKYYTQPIKITNDGHGRLEFRRSDGDVKYQFYLQNLEFNFKPY